MPSDYRTKASTSSCSPMMSKDSNKCREKQVDHEYLPVEVAIRIRPPIGEECTNSNECIHIHDSHSSYQSLEQDLNDQTSTTTTVTPTSSMATSTATVLEIYHSNHDSLKKQYSVYGKRRPNSVQTKEESTSTQYPAVSPDPLQRTFLSVPKNYSPETLQMNLSAPNRSLSSPESRQTNMSSTLHVHLSPFSPQDDGSPRNIRSVHSFEFDHVLDKDVTQEEVYEQLVSPLVKHVLLSTIPCMYSKTEKSPTTSATVLAYGKPKAGKTHTIMGSSIPQKLNSDHALDCPGNGIIPRTFQHIFDALGSSSRDCDNKNNKTVVVKIQFLEVYGDEVHDLLRKDEQPIPVSKPMTRSMHEKNQSDEHSKQLDYSDHSHSQRLLIRDFDLDEDPVVIGANQQVVSTLNEAMEYLHRGLAKRAMGQTAVKHSTSRSHTILTILFDNQQCVAPDGDCNVITCTSKLNFVDLAGAERLCKTHTTGTAFKEGIYINQSLLVLGNVFSVLNKNNSKIGTKENPSYVPYRDSKLTYLLKGSLGSSFKGISRTLLIACLSPSSKDTDESVDCLQLASRVMRRRKAIKTRQRTSASNIGRSDKANPGVNACNKTRAIRYLSPIKKQVKKISTVSNRRKDKIVPPVNGRENEVQDYSSMFVTPVSLPKKVTAFQGLEGSGIDGLERNQIFSSNAIDNNLHYHDDINNISFLSPSLHSVSSLESPFNTPDISRPLHRITNDKLDRNWLLHSMDSEDFIFVANTKESGIQQKPLHSVEIVADYGACQSQLPVAVKEEDASVSLQNLQHIEDSFTIMTGKASTEPEVLHKQLFTVDANTALDVCLSEYTVIDNDVLSSTTLPIQQSNEDSSVLITTTGSNEAQISQKPELKIDNENELATIADIDDVYKSLATMQNTGKSLTNEQQIICSPRYFSSMLELYLVLFRPPWFGRCYGPQEVNHLILVFPYYSDMKRHQTFPVFNASKRGSTRSLT